MLMLLEYYTEKKDFGERSKILTVYRSEK